MKKAIGLELTKDTSTICKDHKSIASFLSENNLETYEYGVIVNEDNLDFVKNFITKENVLEAEFSLFELILPEKKHVFTDFGFISAKSKCYLYEELVIAFSVSGNHEKDLSHALEQMDEHLVAIDRGEAKTFYFTERYHEQLIEGIANAYNINVIFHL